jgi:ADP-ribose pyrophosphatase
VTSGAPKRLGAADVEIVERTTPFRGYFSVDKLRVRHRRYGDGWTGVFEREVFIRPDAVCVLLYDPLADAVVLLEQFRAGPCAHGEENPFIVSLVAGMIEPGESPEDVARRETKEEAGLDLVGRMEPVVEYFTSPGGSSERIHVFCAEVDSRKAGGVHGVDEEDEDILAVVVPFDQALEFATSGGRSLASDVAVALLWLASNRERLRKAWR